MSVTIAAVVWIVGGLCAYRLMIIGILTHDDTISVWEACWTAAVALLLSWVMVGLLISDTDAYKSFVMWWRTHKYRRINTATTLRKVFRI